LRVMFAMDTFPLYGTSESLQFARKLMERGHDVMVVTSDTTTDGRKFAAKGVGVPTQYLPSFRVPGMPYVVTPGSFWETMAIMKRFKPDVVLAMHYVHFTTNMAMLAAHQLRIPRILGIRGPGTSFGASVANSLKKNLTASIGRATIAMSDLVIFDCEASKAAYKVPHSEVVYSPADTTKLHPSPERAQGKFTVTFLGSLTLTKGVIYLVEAAKKFPDARFLIVGEGIEKKRLESLAPSNVEFLGYRRDLQNIMDMSDVFVLPSVSEGVSNSLLEAGACGKACIASNVGGSPEIIEPHYNGLLFKSRDSDDLAECLRVMEASPTLRMMFGERLRKKVVSKFDLNLVVERLEQILVQTVEQFGSRSQKTSSMVSS
jgi:glycosyltransferase involved in cell wall biosynthesis